VDGDRGLSGGAGDAGRQVVRPGDTIHLHAPTPSTCSGRDVSASDAVLHVASSNAAVSAEA